MSHSRLPFTPLLESLPATIPFVGPEAIERRRGRPFALRLGANESAFGVSPRAAVAMREALEHLAWYGDPEGHDLRGALAERLGVGTDSVCLGAGIDELLGVVVRMVAEPGVAVISSRGAYPTFNYHVNGHGADLHLVPYRDDRIDLDALVEAAHARRARLVFLANPDNPMGGWHDANAVRAFVSRLPERCLLILDEAYIEFAPPEARWDIDLADPRVIRTRTFSKAHGMAGARIAYAVAAPEVVVGMSKIRNHFGVNRVAQAGALASLEDPDFVASVVAEVERGRAEYAALAAGLGLGALPSATNFVALDTGDGERARALLGALEARDVFVRMPGVAPLDRCIRVTVGTAEERAAFARVLPEALAAVDSARRV